MRILPAANRRHRPPLRAFTLVELLVVIAIIAVLIGLLLPAVQKVREAAGRTKCANNLHQMALALHGYHDANKMFPRGGYVPYIPNAASPNILSWGTAILPWLEQNALYQTYRTDLPYTDPANMAAGQTVLSVFICPCSVNGNLLRISADRPPNSYARTDYGAVNGERLLSPNTPQKGVLIEGQSLSLADVTDGTSQTIMLGEAPEGIHSLWIDVANVFDQSAPVSMRANPSSPYGSCTIIGNPQQPYVFCDFCQEISSYHPGGAYTAFADGSVHFLSTSLSDAALAALCTRGGGETVTEAY